MQSALYMTCFACALGGAFFLLTALFIDDDRKRTEQITHGMIHHLRRVYFILLYLFFIPVGV